MQSVDLGRRAARTVASVVFFLCAVWALGCGGSDDALSTDSPESRQVREDLAGRTLAEIAESPAGVCRGRSVTGDSSIGVGLTGVWFTCKSSDGSDLLGARVVGLELEDEKIVGAREIRGFSDFFATREERPNASCSLLGGEMDCEPVPREGMRAWPDGSRFSVALEIEDACEVVLVASAKVRGPRASIIWAAGRIEQPRNCE